MAEPGRDYVRARGRTHIVIGLCFVAMLTGIVSAQFSLSMPVIGGSLQYVAVVHKIMEMFSIILSTIVVIISWYTLDRVNIRQTNLVIFGFTFISANHMLHGFILDSGWLIRNLHGELGAIILWLAPHLVELAVIIAIAARAKLPGPPFGWILAALLAMAGIFYAVISHVAGPAEIMTPGQALPSFRRVQYVLAVLALVASSRLYFCYLRSRRSMDFDFSAALFLMAAAELAYSDDKSFVSFTIFLVHFYRVLAYGFVFHAVLTTVLRQPYRKMLESENLLAAKKHELEILLLNVPVTVMCLDKDLRYKYINHLYDDKLDEIGSIIGKQVNFSKRVGDLNSYIAALRRALSGERVEFDVDFLDENGVPNYRSIIVVPDRTADGDIQGVLGIAINTTDRVNAQKQLIKSQSEMEHMAFHDALTGLPNRRLMNDSLDGAVLRAATQGRYGALLLLDVDHFKEINDTLGHVVGDELLQNVASRLRDRLCEGEAISRLGGDEFVIILEDIAECVEDARTHVEGVCDQIRKAVAIPCTLADHVVSTTLTIGAVFFHRPEDRPHELLKQADIALYKAKEEGRNRVMFFTPSLQVEVTERTELMRDLRQAQSHDQLRLYYQPIVDSRQRILGVEALARWMHPVRGIISPDVFIPLAEQGNLISAIGQYVLETACAQLRGWADDDVRSTWTISVNVSARQFHESSFVANVERALAKAGANSGLLYFELTESILHDDLDVTKAKMAILRDLGVRFSLDDFGTGYSSLSYLKQLPLDQLKIDKSFIRDAPNDSHSAAIVPIILSLAKNLGLRVVAEGVETVEQFTLLVEHDCPAFQGHLFCRPMLAEELADTIGELEEV